MPLPDDTFLVFCHTPADLAVAMKTHGLQTGYWFNSTGGSYSIIEPHWGFGTYDIFKTVEVYYQHTAEGDFVPANARYKFVCLFCESGGQIPTRYLVDSPGWSGGWMVDWRLDPVHTLMDVLAVIEVYLEARNATVAELTGAVLSSTVDHSTIIGDSDMYNVLRVSIFDALSYHAVVIDRGVMVQSQFYPDASAGLVTNSTYVPGISDAGVSLGLSVDGISEAIQDLARRDVTIAFDEGRTVVSSHGSEIEEP